MSSGQRALFENNGSVNNLAQTKESGFKTLIAVIIKKVIAYNVYD
jgi:hypothetical protein